MTAPWRWIPSLYFAQGIPYVIVMTMSVVMYKRLGISNTDIALYTSWLNLPWVIKPLWSPVVDILKTRRWWIWVMQLFIGAGLAGDLSVTSPEARRVLGQVADGALRLRAAQSALRSGSYAEAEQMFVRAIEQTLRGLRGERPTNLLNPETWPRKI